MTVVLGIARNPLATRVPDALADAARKIGMPVREVDLPSLVLRIEVGAAAAEVADAAGIVRVTHLAPALLYWQPAATQALGALEDAGARPLNPMRAACAADDKAVTARMLASSGVPQVPTLVCGLGVEEAIAAAGALGYPVVLKRTHGAQGRWVRRAHDVTRLRACVAELQAEGPGALIVQSFVEESAGASLRVLVTGGAVRAATARTAPPGEWRTNVAGGGTQQATVLSRRETDVALGVAAALGLGHVGVDLLRTARGPVVLEANACPDFLSMQPHADVDLAAAVVTATLALGAP